MAQQLFIDHAPALRKIALELQLVFRPMAEADGVHDARHRVLQVESHRIEFQLSGPAAADQQHVVDQGELDPAPLQAERERRHLDVDQGAVGEFDQLDVQALGLRHRQQRLGDLRAPGLDDRYDRVLIPFRSLLHLRDDTERLEALCDPVIRADLIEEGQRKGLLYDPRHVYPMGTGAVPDYALQGEPSLAVLAERAGVHPVEVVIDRLIESEGHELFNMWFFNRAPEALGDYLGLDGVCPGLSDAGAHAGQICDADAPTHYLAWWCRERGRLSFADAIHRLTAKPAAVLGLVDRGTLRVGAYADINVLDAERMSPRFHARHSARAP